ncbi:histidine phosphatase family protein [Exiguobacterium sp. KRL4]|uniref:histidine phosphatase family protein n=1 Tax=Exiguobacterium sp. KRL4 TaxID=1914536 RepID=UPI0008F8D8F5|nr:histidine phosphatase family protein [Exiguobacterium sp. KRL4]OIN65527.1 histidine phosphatase family protein [Exiguobacterium sp. KRL4]
MMIIYLTRHGETEWNIQNRMQGWKDSPLTAKGQQYAEKLGHRLQSVAFRAVYSSPSERAFQTAQLICEGRTTPIRIDARLKEIHMGEWEGKTHDFLKQNDLEAYTAFWETPHLYTSKTGEGFDVLKNRLLEFLKEIQVNYQGETILIVTHGIAIKMLLSHFKGTGMEQLWTSSFIHGTSLTIVESTDQGDLILLEGDMTHVKQDALS